MTLVLNLSAGPSLAAQEPAADPRAADLRLLPVQGNVHVLMGPGANITVQVGPNGVVLVDSMFEPLAPRIAAQVRTLTGAPIRFIINTSLDPDHSGGNAALAALGRTGLSTFPGGGATIIANEHVVNRMVAEASPSADRPRNLPNDEYFLPTKDFYNAEPVILFHEPNAHTDGDSIVLFRRSDVVAAGDVFTPDRYPMIDSARGGSVQGYLAALNHLLRLAVPERIQEGGTRIVPGHGRICNEADLVEYRDMVTIVRGRIQAMVSRGLTLDQVRAARPTLDYDPLYGDAASFVEAVYASLQKR